MSNSAKAVVAGLVCAVAVLAAGLISALPFHSLLSALAFGPGDYAFSYTLRTGVVAFLFGRNAEGSHHLFVLVFSLLAWWLFSSLLVAVIPRVYARMRT